jgi:hypothetical protein
LASSTPSVNGQQAKLVDKAAQGIVFAIADAIARPLNDLTGYISWDVVEFESLTQAG